MHSNRHTNRYGFMQYRTWCTQIIRSTVQNQDQRSIGMSLYSLLVSRTLLLDLASTRSSTYRYVQFRNFTRATWAHVRPSGRVKSGTVTTAALPTMHKLAIRPITTSATGVRNYARRHGIGYTESHGIRLSRRAARCSHVTIRRGEKKELLYNWIPPRHYFMLSRSRRAILWCHARALAPLDSSEEWVRGKLALA